ncbi:Aste57867_2219 [Aphanomyces stellatus]|uniref:Aste57867_2219 protein n=1 Tax=Aphanomyces stellatus TaxID=120398 RepID=A0A485K858_9STRA|nr:hypothetical protein As57867_002214 [Aphanomyces stellatus]VFT79422.1 Aste57867_2219 [Aphanomyces stellatus]
MGDQLRSIHCNLDFLPLELIASGCVFGAAENTVVVQADSAVVQLVLPFLKTLLLIVECVDFLADEGAANDLPLLPATLPSFDSLEKVIQALESIHNPVSSLSMELDFSQSIQEFTQSSATTTLIRLDCCLGFEKMLSMELAIEPTLVALVDRLENEELVDNQAQNAMKVMRQMFLDLRASVTLADAICQIALDATKSQLNDLQQLEHTSGKESALWVCNFHAVEVAP